MNLKLIISFGLSILFSFSIYSCTNIETRTYNLTSSLFAENTSLRIVLIADLHNTVHGKDQSPLINKIKDTNPDLIVLVGDIFDAKSPIIGTQLLLQGIADLAPIYFVSGNHEHELADIVYPELLLYGVIILSDSYEKIFINGNELIIAGIEDHDKVMHDIAYNQRESMERAFRELDEIELYKILLAHRPERIDLYKEFSFNLILSGHTHGGQIRLPFINGLYAPDQGIFPRYGGGIYQHENLKHIISRGLSLTHPRIPRILNPPELVLVIIKSEN